MDLHGRRKGFATAAVLAVLALIASACGASPRVTREVEARDQNGLSTGVAASAAGGTASGQLAQADGAGAAAGAAGGTSGGAAAGGATGSAARKAGAVSGPAAGTAGQVAAGACGAAAPAGGNGGATDTGVSADTIKVGGTFFNGNYLDKYSQVTEQAVKAYFQYTNDQGGICGRKIQFIACDTAGTADGTKGCLSKLADQDKVFTMGPSLDFNLNIVQPTLAADKLPWVGDSGLYGEEFSSPWMFPTQLNGTDVGALIATFAGQTLHTKKAGISLLNDVAGPGCTKRAQEAAKALGYDASATASNGQVETSLDNQVATLQNAGVDTVLFCNDPVNTIKFIQSAQRRGWKPANGFVGGFVAADDVPAAAGSYAAGMYGFTSFDFYKSNTPGIQQYRAITENYYPNTFHHFYEQAAYIGAEAIVAALRKAGPKLTRADFLSALKSFTDFDTGMGLHINFANIGSSQLSSGLMLKADNSLKWQVLTGRFKSAA
ncbi:MAG TPA: ABC transporter substrate-binding protein [Acidimicrobiales bacterium]|nr:ABC transporter substrate-binding protein [Acidimicrobiales bacterium]